MKPDTGNEVVDAVLHAAHRIRTSTDTQLRAEGLTLPSFKLLRALSQGDKSMREISEILHVAPRTVTDIINGLEARELVARHPHPTDGRVTLLHITDVGTNLLTEATVGADRARDAAIIELTEAERATLRQLLGRVAPRHPGGTGSQAGQAAEGTRS